MPGHDIIVIGASAGGVETLPKLVSQLPSEIPAAIFVVLHISATSKSYLPSILSRAGELKAIHAKDREKIKNGRIYVAPPDHHLWLENSHVRVTHGPRVNRHRPAVDPLFETAAHNYGPRTVGIVLTGALDDGTVGLQAVKSCGGVAIVQDPAEAPVPSMPENARRFVEVDHCLPVEKISKLVVRLSDTKVRKTRLTCPQLMKFKMDEGSMNVNEMTKKFGSPSGFVCPECNGPLWQIKSGKTKTFKCLVGHALSPESLLAEDAVAVERALWVAVKTLQERSSLLRNLAEGHDGNGSSRVFAQRAEDAEQQAKVIRDLIRRFDR